MLQDSGSIGREDLQPHRALMELVTERHLSAHVIGNTMGAMSALVDACPISAKTLASKLARFWRFVRDDSALRALSYELDGVRSGLEILGIRMGGRLVWRVEAGKRVSHLMVPALAVQAMVDLAVAHGVEASSGLCTLTIRSGLSGKSLYVEVEDSGIDWTATCPQSFTALRRALEVMSCGSDSRNVVRVSKQRNGGYNVIRLDMLEEETL